MNCSICFENIEQLYSKWNCNHTFHYECVKNWNNGCPYCRCRDLRIIAANERQHYVLTETEIRDKHFPKQNVLQIESMRQYIDVPGNSKDIYKSLWKKTDCITNNHEFLIKRSYGCIMICTSCNLIKTFNLMHTP